MKKIYILIVLTLFFHTVFSQCTPDPGLIHTGFTPAELPFAYTDAPYSQVLSFKAPKDTVAVFNGNTVNVEVDSVIMLELTGIPTNFKYECLNRCAVLGGEKGCALLSGQADSSQIGSYRIGIRLKTYYRIKNTTNQFDREDYGDSYQFRIYKTTGLKAILSAQTAIEVKTYPNPSAGVVQFDLSSLPHHTHGTLHVFDVLGRNVYQSTFSHNNAEPLLVENWKTGMYKCMVQTSEGVYYTSFVKN